MYLDASIWRKFLKAVTRFRKALRFDFRTYATDKENILIQTSSRKMLSLQVHYKTKTLNSRQSNTKKISENKEHTMSNPSCSIKLAG